MNKNELMQLKETLSTHGLSTSVFYGQGGACGLTLKGPALQQLVELLKTQKAQK